MERHFSRQEVLRLTGVTSNKLSYLDRTKLVCPNRLEVEGYMRPQVVYTLSQILQIKTIYRLREELSLQEIRKVLDELEKQGYEPSLFRMNLLFFNGELYLLEGESEVNEKIIQLTGKHRGQVILHRVDPIGDVVEELYREAQRHHILDFVKRVEGTPIATAH